MQTQTITGEAIRQHIITKRDAEANERATVDKVREIVSTFEGKQLNRRLKTKIEAEIGCVIHMEHTSYGGWTMYLWGDAIGRKYDNRVLLFLPGESRAEREGWTTLRQQFEGNNPAYYAGCDERQAQRAKALNGSNAPEEYAEAVFKLRVAIAELKRLTAYKEPLAADEYSLRDAFIGEGVKF